MTRKYSDSDLIRLFVDFRENDNESSFNEFVKSINKPLFHKIKSKVNDDFASEEILQKTWIKVNETKHKYNESLSTPFNWIFTNITWIQIRHWFRDNRNYINKFTSINDGLENESDCIDTYNPPLLNQVSNYIDKEKYRIIHKAIFKLPNKNHQDVIILNNFGGLTLKYIAEIMNRNEITVRGWNVRALARLAELLKDIRNN